MKTLLVLAQHPDLAEAVRTSVNSERYRVVHRANLEEAEPLLAHGLTDACLVDVELTGVPSAWMLERLRRRAPKIPLIIVTGERQSEWEEEAYISGATYVVAKPLRARLLNALLERLWPTTEPSQVQSPAAAAPFSPQETSSPPDTDFLRRSGTTTTLGVLRDFSAILTHSLNAEGMLRQLLLLQRELLSINRAAVFLRQPSPEFGLTGGLPESKRLRAACSTGIAPGLLEHLELSLEAG